VDVCLNFFLNSVIRDPDAIGDLDFAALLRVFEFCVMAAPREARFMAMVADCEEFLEWVPIIASDQRLGASSARLVNRICQELVPQGHELS
jgi:hypothetical protein